METRSTCALLREERCLGVQKKERSGCWCHDLWSLTPEQLKPSYQQIGSRGMSWKRQKSPEEYNSMCVQEEKKFPTMRKNVNIVNLGLVLCSKHDVSGDRRHESPRIRLKDSCKRKRSSVRWIRKLHWKQKVKRKTVDAWRKWRVCLDVYVAPPDCHEKKKDFHRQGIRWHHLPQDPSTRKLGKV